MICDKSYNTKDKAIAVGLASLLFLILAAPFTYRLTDRLASYVNLETERNDLPTYTGVIIHGVVYAVIVRLLLNKSGMCQSYSNKNKWIVALMAGLLFALLSSPDLIQLVENKVTRNYLPVNMVVFGILAYFLFIH